MVRKFVHFEEIEGDLKENAPEVVYKYRTWNDKYHKGLLEDQLVWFSHPFDLNDPLDVRPETVFDIEEFKDERYLQKLMDSAEAMNTHITDVDVLKRLAHEQWEYTKANPDSMLQVQKERNSIRENFEPYGVFSTTLNPFSESTWAMYGDDGKGYCMGFRTVELCRQMKSGYGFVNYSDEPFKFSFLSEDEDKDLDALYLKKTSWKDEEEFRFITVGVGIYSERLQTFSPDVAAEVILGANVSKEHEAEIIDIVRQKYPPGFPLYKISKSEIGLTKIQIL